MSKILIFIGIAFVVSCSNKYPKETFSKEIYENRILSENTIGFEKQKIVFYLPSNYKINDNDYDPEYKEISYSYKGGEIFYITNNTWSGSPQNRENRISKYDDIIRRKDISDTLKYSGKQPNGHYWLEYVLNDIVVGYVNVPEVRKAEFDQAVASLKRKK